MGEFSWIYSDTKRRIINNREKDAYLLVPPPFQEKYGKAIYESCYGGYGHFGSYDVYRLIPEWNKEMIPEIIRRIKQKNWRCSTSKYDVENLQKYYDGEKINTDLRELGIIMACYDEDNFALLYPIKITSKLMDYEKAEPSEGDPDQGWA